MLERFGRLCGWTGNGLAILLIGTAIFLPADSSRTDYLFARIVFLVVPGVLAFLIGQAVRYVLVAPRPVKNSQD